MFALGSICCAACLLPVMAAAEGPPDTATLSPYFVVEGGDPELDRMPLAHTQVDFSISGVIADVVVTQHYKNTGARPISARYVFPASTRAAVTGLRMRVGAQTISAVIQERAAAERRYQQAKTAGQTASLLQQDRPNVFTMQVANIMPGDRIEVELRYNELLVPEEGMYEFVYPTVVGPRYGRDANPVAAEDAFVRSPYLHDTEEAPSTLTINGSIAAGMPLQALEVPSHEVRTRAVDSPTPSASTEVTLPAGTHGDRDFILRYRLQGQAVQSGLVLYDGVAAGDDENVFLLTVQPPARPQSAEIPAREYIFVLDVSGSMYGFPLDTAKLVLARLTAQLRARDSFNVLLFSGDSRELFPRAMPATAANVEMAMAAIGAEAGGGATELHAALLRALAMPSRAAHTSRTFVVVTDGYISAERSVFELVRARVGDANLFTIGIGSSVNRYLVEGLARAGLGEAFVVTDPQDASDMAERFATYISTPVLTDITITSEDFEVYDLLPEQHPDLLASRPLLVLGKWRGPAAGKLRIEGYSGLGRFTQEVNVAAAEPSEQHAVVSRLWARQRIADISDFAMGNESEREREEVAVLGLRYSMLTKFTSFVAVAEVARNDSGSESVDQPLPIPTGVSDRAVAGMAGAPEPPLWSLLVGISGLLLTLALRKRKIVGRSVDVRVS